MIVLVVPVSETARLAAPRMIHPYILRATSNAGVEGLASAILVARWKARDDYRPGLRLIMDATTRSRRQ
jgi:hypothetical protein